MSNEKDGLYDKYRVIKTEDLDLLSQIAEDETQTPEVIEAAVQTLKWIDMFSIDGMRDQGAEGSHFVFVLRPDKDYHALVALNCYAASVAAFNPKMSEEIFQAIDLMEMPTNMEPD